jgi:hypothetical protein
MSKRVWMKWVVAALWGIRGNRQGAGNRSSCCGRRVCEQRPTTTGMYVAFAFGGWPQSGERARAAADRPEERPLGSAVRPAPSI